MARINKERLIHTCCLWTK